MDMHLPLPALARIKIAWNSPFNLIFSSLFRSGRGKRRGRKNASWIPSRVQSSDTVSFSYYPGQEVRTVALPDCKRPALIIPTSTATSRPRTRTPTKVKRFSKVVGMYTLLYIYICNGCNFLHCSGNVYAALNTNLKLTWILSELRNTV